ncbi:MAG: tyrosine-protein phosphatase [Candidatus Obscuribacterales bacterium]
MSEEISDRRSRDPLELELELESIPRFYRVSDRLYRGGQPSDNDLELLKRSNFKSIVSLRSKIGHIDRERKLVDRLGMKYYNIPLFYFRAPRMEEIDLFLHYLDQPENVPLFVHCLHGVDRTGFVIAMYRIKRCGWTFEEAYQEMVACGFHKIRVWHYKQLLKRMARHHQRGT